ncbi:HAD-IIA family hydrolase [uncultured Citricoccus sp.]|uniref:HAD-IIA family hydrolase n=1 Tax=uncultured Citricoccus sp. TaxID=614031 RepID=UPI002609A2D0|nr:HAD-IIA family hydrolase [uncultured Citricoccus sp.]
MNTPLKTSVALSPGAPATTAPDSEDGTAQIGQVRAVMFDVDGCLLLADQPSGYGGTVLPGARRALEAVRATGREFVCFTNGSFQTPAAIASTLRELGLEVSDEQVMTPAVVAAETIAHRHPGGRVLAFGGPGVTEPLSARGIDLVELEEAAAGRAGEVAAVVVGWDTEFVRSKIVAASEVILSGAELYTTSAAPTFASHERLNVGVSGFIAAGLTHVTGRPYRVLGKPSAEAFQAICSRTHTQADQMLVVGDDLQLETLMARQHGAMAVLVTTGTHSRQDAALVEAEHRPDLILDSLDELADLLETAPVTPTEVS